MTELKFSLAGHLDRPTSSRYSQPWVGEGYILVCCCNTWNIASFIFNTQFYHLANGMGKTYLSASSNTTYSTDANFRSISIITWRKRPGVAIILRTRNIYLILSHDINSISILYRPLPHRGHNLLSLQSMKTYLLTPWICSETCQLEAKGNPNLLFSDQQGHCVTKVCSYCQMRSLRSIHQSKYYPWPTCLF